MRELAIAWLAGQGYHPEDFESSEDSEIFKVVLLESFFQGEQYERGRR